MIHSQLINPLQFFDITIYSIALRIIPHLHDTYSDQPPVLPAMTIHPVIVTFRDADGN